MDWPRPRTALLVDDSTIVRERLVQGVERIPNLVVVGQCEDAESALACLHQLQPDILVLDIRLTGGGMKLLRHAVRHCPHMLVVVLTNQADDQTRRICLGNGAHHFIDKSSEFDRLFRLLADLVPQGRAP